MLIKRPADIPSSEITPEGLYRARRQFLGQAGALALAATLGGGPLGALAETRREGAGKPLAPLQPSPFSTDEPRTPYKDVTHYNNFYEFGADKEDPAERAHLLRPAPWSVTLEGALERPGTYALEDLLKPHALEERVYRLRCVEAWSMVIPWVGFPLGDLLRRFQPTSNAKYVEFTTLHDPEQMPGQRRPLLDWPYVEGLRLDEAMHPLTLLAVGLYGEVLPNQNGAPLRLVVPWKYGFKSIKSIVRIRLLETPPVSSWMRSGPDEYGFYANVNPTVDHPRWSQKTERRLDGGWFGARRKTLMFNGYAEQVASLYQGMDLRIQF